MNFPDRAAGDPPRAAAFGTTRWSVVLAAGSRSHPDSAQALETLCRAYWYPLYAYIRRRGHSAADAQDLTQDFFAGLIGRESLGTVRPEAGSFRSFLLASVNHLLANEWDRARALKRGGGQTILSIEAEEAEGRFLQEPEASDSPERIFERRWALTLLERALARMREEFSAAGKAGQFAALKGFLSDLAGEGEYAAVAGRLGLTAGGVAVLVHRMRQRYREVVRAEIADTVADEAEVEGEMRQLFAALA